MPSLIKCKHCHKEFEVVDGTASSFCSEECRKAHKAQLRKARRPKQARGRQKAETQVDKKAEEKQAVAVEKKAKSKAKEAAHKVIETAAAVNTKGINLDDLFPAEVWEQRPTDIETFLFDRNYLGNSWLDSDNNRTMFPFWQEMSKKIFPLPMKSPYNTIIFSGATGLGKALAHGTKIICNDGEKPIEKILPGDLVFGPDGKVHPVLGVFPQGEKEVARVKFSDGTSILCSWDHLWTVGVGGGKRSRFSTFSTEEIYKRLERNNQKKFQFKPSLPAIQPLDYPEKQFKCDPYVLGALLGDGCFSDNLIITSNDPEIPGEISKRLNCTTRLSSSSNWYFYNKQGHLIKSREVIPEELFGTKSATKYIPEEYFYGSVQQRLDLLRGLMDTDGCAHLALRKKGGSVSDFCSISEKLAEGLIRLARSLGMRATKFSYRGSFKGVKRDTYKHRVKINSQQLNPFLLKRKAEIWTPPKSYLKRLILEIVPDGRAECTCISIDSADHLYLAENYIPTHNTSIAMGICLAYYLHIVLCLRDPHKYFGLADQKNLVFAILNITTKAMAYKNAWGTVHRMLLNSPWFMARGVKSEGKRPEWTCTTKPVELIFGRNADDLIGLDILFAFMDEISFYRNASIESQIKAATDVYNAAWERMKSRFVKFGGIFDGLMVLASSKRTDQSFLESFIKKILESQDSRRVLVIDKPRWEVLPPESYCGKRFPVAVGDKFRPSQIIREDQVQEFTEAGYKIYWPPIENYGEFERDMNNALTNIAGVSVGQISSFLRGDLVTSCIDKGLNNPFKKSIIYSGFKDTTQYYEYFDTSVLTQEDYTLPLFVHLDASLGRDGNSIVGVLADYAINQKDTSGNYQQELHYRELFKIKVRAPQGTETGLDKNTKFILWLSQRFNLQAISHDQFQSKSLHQDLLRKGINVVQQSVDAVKDGINPVYAVFKDVLYEKRVSLLDDEDQLNELVSLEKYENGKIDKPQGGSDDVAQCLAGAVYLASLAKEEMLASGVVLLKQLDSSDTPVAGAQVNPEKLIEDEMAKHFATYSPEAIKTTKQSTVHDDWEKFFGKDKKKDQGDLVNPGMYWG